MKKPEPEIIEELLYELCVRLGFCLPPKAQDRLNANPPTDIGAFTDAVFREEGMDPTTSANAHLRKQVHDCVEKHFNLVN